MVYDRAGKRLAPAGAGSLLLTQVPFRLWVTLGGEPQEGPGFLVHVSDIRSALAEALEKERVKASHTLDVMGWARGVMKDKFRDFKLLRLEVELNERLKVSWRTEDQEMIQVTKKYELAASHRLWNPDWGEKRNFAVYGKCSNPRGHGHNYILEVTLRGKPDRRTGQAADLEEIDRVVRENVIERFDHKNLNEDTSEFAEMIPTVENMVKVFWELLLGKFSRGELVRVAVWETAKTYAEYFGPTAGPLRYSDAV